MVYMSVDTTDIPIQYSSRSGKSRSQTFSIKNHQYSIKIETGVTHNGLIVYYNGIYYHDWHDLSIFKVGLSKELMPNEKVFADKAYQSSQCITPYKKRRDGENFTLQMEEHNRIVGHYRAIVENLNANLKDWGILTLYRGRNMDFPTELFYSYLQYHQ